MAKSSTYKIISNICLTIGIISQIFHAYYPHPLRGLTGNLILLVGFIFALMHAKKNNIKLPLYDPVRKKHIRNWIVFVLAAIITIIIVVVVHLGLK